MMLSALAVSVLLSSAPPDGDGRQKYLAGDYAGAVVELNEKLKKYPEGWSFLALRGLARVRSKDAAAAADIKAVLAKDPENGVALLARGVLNGKKGSADLCAALTGLIKSQQRELTEEARRELGGTKLVTVKLLDGGPRKYDAIAVVRAITGLDVDSAKQIVGGSSADYLGGRGPAEAGPEPRAVIESICAAQAAAFQKKLTAAGATVRVE